MKIMQKTSSSGDREKEILEFFVESITAGMRKNTMANSVVVTENDMSLCIGCMACLHVSEQLHSSRLLLSL